MVIVTHLALLAAIAAPQGPDRPPIVRHADVLPADALAVVSTAPWESHRATLAASGLDRALIDPDGLAQRLRRGVLARMLGADAPEVADLEDLGSLGASFAVLAPDRSGTFAALAAIDCDAGDRDALRAGLGRRAGGDGALRAVRLRGRDGFEVETPFGALVLVVLENRVLIGTTHELVAAAVARADGAADDALRTDPRFASFSTHNSGEGAPWLCTTYVDLDRLVRWSLSMAPRPERDAIATWIDRAGLGSLQSLGLLIGSADQRLVERVWVGTAQPRGGLLDALLPSGGLPTAGLATLVPADATSFGASRIRVHAAWKATMAMLEADAPDTAAQVRGVLAMVGGQLGGIDIERDLLSALGERVVSMSWPAGDGSPDTLLALDLTAPDRFAGALAKMPFLAASPLAGYELYLPDAGPAPAGALAVGDGRLVFASSERRLRRWIAERRAATPNARVEQALRALPDDVIGVGFVDVGRAAADVMAGLDAATGLLPEGAATLGRTLGGAMADTGVVAYELRSDTTGYAAVLRSDRGGAVRAFAAVLDEVGRQVLAEPEVAAMVAHAQSADRSRGARALEVLRAIRSAEQAHHAAHGSYADLETLLETGALPLTLLDARATRGVFAIDDALVTVLLPEGDRRDSFAAVVWPADSRAGEILACTDRREPVRNDLLARVSGLGTPEFADLFVAGTPDGDWTPGWREVEVAERAEVRGTRTTDSTMFRVLTALEEQGDAGARELVGYLAHEDPLVAARAAWSLGRLRHAPAVPALIELLKQHEDPTVRRHAMGALRTLRDPRTATVSIAALGDTDALVRSLAAANLGALRHDAAKDALVAALARPEDDDPTPVGGPADDTDAVASLLALGDLGDGEQLLPAATAYDRGSKAADEALVWLFQQLSPRLPAEREATVLMAVLDHRTALLRRYAIQRLGELAEPRTAAALEARLAQESDELRPLVEVSLAAVRGDGNSDDGASGSLGEILAPWIARAEELYADREVRTYALAGVAGLLVLSCGLMFALRRRRRAREADNWAAMTRPSTDFEATASGRTPRYEDYVPDGEEAIEAEWADGSSEDGAWDEAGYEEAGSDDLEEVGEDQDWETEEATRP